MMMRVPVQPLVTRVVVGSGFDAADDWIAERASSTAVVITADILLAERCLKAGASVIASNGKPFTPNSIGSAIDTRAIMTHLRPGGEANGGPPPLTTRVRSRLLAPLYKVMVRRARHP